MYGPPMMQQAPSSLPVAGGAMLLIAGVLGILMWGILFALPSMISIPMVPGVDVAGYVSTVFYVCGGIGIILSVFAIIGGFFATQRRMWGLGILGGITGLLSVGFFIGSLLALIGLILIAVSHRDFT